MLQGFVQIFLTLFLVVMLVPIVGHYLAQVFFMHKTWLDPVMNPLERLIYLLIDIEPQKSMTGREYAIALLLSNTAMAVLALLLLLFQSLLPLNPTDLGKPTWDTALHTTISFLVAADLQHYLLETTMSYLNQITALGFLMFVAPATGLAVGIAFIRGLTGSLLNLFLQVFWGAMGTGAASLVVYMFLAVFLTGLIVGRTPEFLGRKIEKREITLASVIILIHPLLILLPSAITLAFPDQLAGMSNPGFHGFTQVIYEYASAAAGNGSGFEGLADTQPAPTALWWNLTTAFTLWMGRFIPIITLLLLADSLSYKQPVPTSIATLNTDTQLFTSVTAATILILGALTFFPVLVLGPVAEAFQIAIGR